MNPSLRFSTAPPRPFPVVVLADASGSMAADGKIVTLNRVIDEMIRSLAAEPDVRAELQVGVIAFGGERARPHVPLTPAASLAWLDLQAGGRTPLGDAFRLVTRLLEDRESVPPRAYRPTLVLVSDGRPTDDWEGPLKALLASERAAKADRLALAVGADADESVLKAFLARPGGRIFRAGEAARIRDFFRFVTMSVTGRSRSAAPEREVDLDRALPDDVDF